ncbi:pyrroloquinoline quinone biosynthesis peptide chaperone PqqD [Marinobacter sediminum]|uniref:pyrroloquinoline quinone biosynthesis peptide chaperone PqqD n=1 Tax=Marinobacter sediminum TaxID=256323 RepID=UPI0035655B75
MSEGVASRIPRLRRGFRFQWEPVQNCHVLLYPEGMVKLNDSAGAILEKVDGQRNVELIVASLELKFPDESDLGADVREFLKDAVQRHWVEWL